MSWLAAAAFAQFAAGGLKASALKRQQYKEADEDEYYADQIMRNYYKNVQRKRTSLTQYVTDRADEGGQMFGEVARAGDRAVGKVVSAVSASGAVGGEAPPGFNKKKKPPIIARGLMPGARKRWSKK